MLKFEKYAPEGFDYKLEDGELLHFTEWNGEYYETESGIYRPIYKQIDDDEWEIIGFEKD